MSDAYFLNLSLIAVGFASVSALVMLLRQMMGGALSRFDIHLITCYLTGAFAVVFGAVFPVLMLMASTDPLMVWGISGVFAAVIVAAHLTVMIVRRRRITGAGAPPWIVADWTIQGLSAAALLVNIGWPRSAWLYAFALTVVLGMVMLAFIRRLASLLSGQELPHDWDARRG